jgi:hypothetical protein
MGRTPGGKPLPNGVDFWWDEFPTNSGNCWYNNIGSSGTTAITSDPPPPPVPGTSIPKFLPEDCAAPTNVGVGDPAKEAMLVSCAASMQAGSYDGSTCDWFQMPAKPGTQAAARQEARNEQTALQLSGHAPLDPFCNLIGGTGGTLTCDPFRQR